MRAIAAGLALLLIAPAPALAKASVSKPSFAQRVQRVEDELAIRRILIDYHHYLDAHDAEGYANLFARDGAWVNGGVPHKGHDEIVKLLRGIWGTPRPGDPDPGTILYTHTTNMRIDLHGDHATAWSRHLMVKRGPDGKPFPNLAGRYEDALIRENGVWKIQRRTDFPVMPTQEEWQKIMSSRMPAQTRP
ncbi:nuclear transport factor 2 family protein [Sphingobium nicotianae]|uniref:SgcJ/EcaC family oxidoreductase n=1 Tax=Sphingobium nicotianae TaxID=2782607 RepID=A0A9X1DAH1_9SPHN|nr:nuclear transport factor 2 family protein [Sphingobium nicotianae]MBT2186437.1 SgcJ/EcaC family oxidoreductase [Sphingobium nicotianae]